MVLLTYLLDPQGWRRRLLLYAEYSVVASIFWFPVLRSQYATALVFAVLALALLKDVVADMYLIRGGRSPAFYDWVEHNPFNFTLLLYLFTGSTPLSTELLAFGLTHGQLAGLLAFIDLLVDGGQDVGVEWRAFLETQRP